MNSDVQLLGITYSEFDNKVGPQLKYSYPVDVLSSEAFEAYSDYVIVSKQLCEKLIVVTFDDVQFLNYSVAIDNVKYHRNALLFAFGFVLARGVETEPYGAVLEKIASTFVNLEIESEFLFQPSSRNRIQDFLRVLFFQLNEKNEAFVDLGLNNSYLAVKLYRAPMKPADICDWDVPIFRRDRIDLSYLPWDISYQHLIPHIDGISHIKKIVYEVGMDIDSVRRTLKLLIYHGAILMTDVFKFTNIYKLNTEEAIALLSNPTLMLEMRVFSAFVGKGSTILPSANQIISFLLQLQPDKSIQQILLDSFATAPSPPADDTSPRGDAAADNSGTLEAKGEKTVSAETHSTSISSPPSSSSSPPLDLRNLDISRLIAFAKSHGMIRRVHEYPLYIPTSTSSVVGGGGGGGGGSGASGRSGVSHLSSSDLLANNYHHPSTASMASDRGAPPNYNTSAHYQNPIFDISTGANSTSSGADNKSTVSSSYTRSGNLPMPSSSLQGSSGAYLQSASNFGHHGMEAAASVGLSGVLSAANSLVAAPTAINKEINVRKGSFGASTQDRSGVVEALSYVQSYQPQQNNNSSNGNNAYSGNNISRMPRFSQPLNTQTITAVGHSSSMQVLPAVSPAPIGEESGNFSDRDKASAFTPPPPALSSSGTASHRPSLHRYTSRSKMTAGQNFLHNNHLHLPAAAHAAVAMCHPSSAAAAPTVSSRIEVRDILHRLTGKEHMDTICCRFDLTYYEIVNFPGVQLIYK